MVHFFEEHWPLVAVLMSGEITDADLDAMRVGYRRIYDRGQRFFLLQETRESKIASATMRAKLAGINDSFADEAQAHVIAAAVVVPGRVAASALRAIFWMTQKRTEILSMDSAAKAYAKAQELCAAESLSLPASAQAFCEALDRAWARDKSFAQIS